MPSKIHLVNLDAHIAKFVPNSDALASSSRMDFNLLF